jgi:hypothetical protein
VKRNENGERKKINESGISEMAKIIGNNQRNIKE